jgi:hypothetical protein
MMESFGSFERENGITNGFIKKGFVWNFGFGKSTDCPKSADDVKMALFLIISDKLSLRGGSLQGLDFGCRGAKLRSSSSRHIVSSIRAETGHFSTELNSQFSILNSTVTEQLFKAEYPHVEVDRQTELSGPRRRG